MDSISQLSLDDIPSPSRKPRMTIAEKYPAPGYKRCSMCRKSLPVDQYNKNKKGKDGRASWCMSCDRAYYERRKEAGLTDKRDMRAYHLQRNYGLTLDEYNSMIEQQGGCCAICRGSSNGKSWHVDHDHETGAIRGILCNGCNTALGGMRDSPAILRAAADYLERHGK